MKGLFFKFFRVLLVKSVWLLDYKKYFHSTGTDRTTRLRQADEKSCCYSFAELFICRMNGDTQGRGLVCAGVMIRLFLKEPLSQVAQDEMVKISEGKRGENNSSDYSDSHHAAKNKEIKHLHREIHVLP